MGNFIETERHGRIVVLRMNRPETMNAIRDFEDCGDMVRALAELAEDTRVAAAILTGNGRAFSAGGNLAVMKEKTGIGPRDLPDDTRRGYRKGVQEITRMFVASDVPLIAAVNGAAVGLGCDIACLCDIRLASEKASFSAGFAKVGLIPGDGGAWTLQRAVGYSRAAEMMFITDRYDAHAAREIGLVSEVFAADALMDGAMALAERIAANPVRAVRMTKRLLRAAQQQSIGDVLELSAAFQAIAHETGDHREAIDAFLEKRDASFTGD